MIRFRCQKCGKKLKAEEEIVGRKVRCTRCESIEIVPESDNLIKPMSQQARLATNKPKVSQFKSTPTRIDSNTVNLDQPVELSGDSTSSPSFQVDFEPRFNVVHPRDLNSNLRRLFLFGLIGVFLVSVVAVAFNFNWLMDARRRFSTDYQNLPEVVYYRNHLTNLEKSRRMMYVAGRNCIAANQGAPEEIKELEDYNSSIESFTKNPDLIDQVETLFYQGEDQKARALLVNTAKEMIAMRSEVELRTRSYQAISD